MADVLRVGVAGAGAWGTALASAARRAGSEVTLWAREMDTVKAINRHHENTAFLPGIPLDPSIRAIADLAGLGASDVVVLAPPSAHLARVCQDLGRHLSEDATVCVGTKGIEPGSGRLMHEVASTALGLGGIAGLSGPSFAAELASGLPTAVAAAGKPSHVARIIRGLANPAFTIHPSDDITGLGIGGAVKNVIAIACGIVQGLGAGHNAHAAVIVLGLAEIIRLGDAMGARRETLMGLAGLGDLVLTCTGTLSRNFTFGRAVGEGRRVEGLLSDRKDVVEGAEAAPAVTSLAERLGVPMPLSRTVNDILDGRADPSDVVACLMDHQSCEAHPTPRP